MGCGEADAGGRRRWRSVRRGCDGQRRGGGEQRGAGAQRRTGTWLKEEGDVVMEDADESPTRRAQDQQRGRGDMGRRTTGAQASAEEATGQWDARRIEGTASSVGQNGQQTGSSIGMWYSDGAERGVVTGENGRRRRGAALCLSGAARRQGSDLQLSAWQEGAALKTLSLRAPCSGGLTTPGLGGRAPQCKCSGGNSASVSGAWGVQGDSPDHRYTHPPPPSTQGARQAGWGEGRGPREHPGERIWARGRGRGRARGWHTRVTALHGQGGQKCRQGRQREGEWEGRQAREGAQRSGTRVTRRRAEGTRRARGSSEEREHRTKKKTKQRQDRRTHSKGT